VAHKLVHIWKSPAEKLFALAYSAFMDPIEECQMGQLYQMITKAPEQMFC